jgi:hypothetical protein
MILTILASALLLAPRYGSPYWTVFSVEALGWATLAYVSFEPSSKAVTASADNRETNNDDNDDDSTRDDWVSQATVSADAEDAFEEVLLELKDRSLLLRRNDNVYR